MSDQDEQSVMGNLDDSENQGSPVSPEPCHHAYDKQLHLTLCAIQHATTIELQTNLV